MTSKQGVADSPMGRVEALASRLIYAYRIESPHWDGRVAVTSVKIKLPDVDGGDTLIVVLGTDEDGTPVVGFHGGIGILEALAGALSRIGTGNMRWRQDEYANKYDNGRDGGGQSATGER